MSLRPEPLDSDPGAVAGAATPDATAAAALDRLGRLACRVLRVPVAGVVLGEAGREPLILEDARDHPRVRDDEAAVAYAGVPLIASDGRVLGSFRAVDHRPRSWSAADVATLTELAGAAVTLVELRRDRGRLAARLAEYEAVARDAQQERIDAGERLQRGLLPSRPTTGGHGQVFTFYRPGARTMLLGGDFFDVVDGDGALHFIIADVAGHGPEAAASAVALRAAWVALQQHPVTPLIMLRHLNAIILREARDDTMFITALAGSYDSTARTLELASAGHPLPMLLAGGATRELALVPGPPLGLFADSDWERCEIELSAGSAMLAYTDGLVEGRAAPEAVERLGTERILGMASRAAVDGDLPRALYDVAAAANGGPLEDDVAIIVLRPA
ncbi:MAG TPA: GAF domain-containing SpoIIE family protein phosphatase [Baekduia sp.]